MIPFVGAGATIAKQVKKAKDKFGGVYDLVVRNSDEVKGYVGQSSDTFKRIKNNFNPKRGKLAHTVIEETPTIYKMVGSTKLEREIYEQFVILRKYRGQINPSKNPLAKLLNKVNPVGGRFDLGSDTGRRLFEKKSIGDCQKI